MTEGEYLEQRLDDQINWYDQKSLRNQKLHKFLQWISIICAALIPFLAGYLPDYPGEIRLVIEILSIVIAAVTAFLALYKFEEKWVEYRTVCETLKHEKYYFLTKVTPYNSADAFPLLVRRVEALISRDNSLLPQQVNMPHSVK